MFTLDVLEQSKVMKSKWEDEVKKIHGPESRQETELDDGFRSGNQAVVW